MLIKKPHPSKLIMFTKVTEYKNSFLLQKYEKCTLVNKQFSSVLCNQKEAGEFKKNNKKILWQQYIGTCVSVFNGTR